MRKNEINPHLVFRHVAPGRRNSFKNIHIRIHNFHQHLVLTEVRQNSHFQLTIVRRHNDVARGGFEYVSTVELHNLITYG